MSNFEFNISSANSDTRIINPRGSPADVSNVMQRIKCLLFESPSPVYHHISDNQYSRYNLMGIKIAQII